MVKIPTNTDLEKVKIPTNTDHYRPIPTEKCKDGPDIDYAGYQAIKNLIRDIHFFQGTGCEMYTEILSPSFVGMTFNQASVLCFTKLKLLLLAIETKSDIGKPKNI